MRMNVLNTLGLLSDEYILKILELTSDRSMNITSISNKLNIPLSSCYRRIEDMTASGLVRCYIDMTEGGRRSKVYHSLIRKMDVHFRCGEMIITMEDFNGKKTRTQLDLELDNILEYSADVTRGKVIRHDGSVENNPALFEEVS